MTHSAEVGVFGGSGFYAFVDDVQLVRLSTPYGQPSDELALATVAGRRVAFLPRHGRKHSIPPHKINYRANIHAMNQLGVTRILSPAAVGSLQPGIRRGDFVIADQFVDRTTGRSDTFFDGPTVAHIAGAEPFCPALRQVVAEAGDSQNIRIHREGTIVVINGPRFSTKAESRWFSRLGWHVINMTQYPEVVLARELGICYCSIALVTDYDAGLADEPDTGHVTVDEILRVLADNNERVKHLLLQVIESLPPERSCRCEAMAREARLG